MIIPFKNHKNSFNDCRLIIFMIIRLLTQIRKYKEDDFTDSNAVAFSQDVFIHFLHVVATCQIPALPSSSPQQPVKFRELSW